MARYIDDLPPEERTALFEKAQEFYVMHPERRLTGSGTRMKALPRTNEIQIENQKVIIQQLKEKNETFYDSLPEKLKLKIGGVINVYAEFYNDLPLLVGHKFIVIKDEQLYCDSKSFLHDYFKDITPKGKNTKWEPVHNLFGIKGLNTAKTIDKDSRPFGHWKDIKQDMV
jgi:hypothetical protein